MGPTPKLNPALIAAALGLSPEMLFRDDKPKHFGLRPINAEVYDTDTASGQIRRKVAKGSSKKERARQKRMQRKAA